MGLPLYRGPVGEPGVVSFARTFERNKKCIWVPFLDLEVIKILSLSEAYLKSGTLVKEQGSFNLV
jgi:hypothetical protein